MIACSMSQDGTEGEGSGALPWFSLTLSFKFKPVALLEGRKREWVL